MEVLMQCVIISEVISLNLLLQKKAMKQKMLKIKFKYRDEMSNWKWRMQSCIVKSIEECKRIYDLGVDCDYEILEVTETK